MIDGIALWVLFCGMWPVADPGHGLDTPLSAFDLALHLAAGVVLFVRWRARREALVRA